MEKKKLDNKEKEVKKENKFLNFLKKFFNSWQPLLVILILVIAGLLMFINHLMHATKTYMFNGSNDYVRILNGVTVINDSLAIFEGSDVDFIYEKDIMVTKYKIGYYVKVDGKLSPISVISGEDEETLSLTKLLEGGTSFNVIESVSNEHYFSKENVDALKDGLYFVIEFTPKKGDEVKLETKLDISDMSKWCLQINAKIMKSLQMIANFLQLCYNFIGDKNDKQRRIFK